MSRVIHLIPYNGTGGVEVAARTMQAVNCSNLEFSVQSMYPSVAGYRERGVTFRLTPIFSAFARVQHHRPDVLIVSLWRAFIVGVLVKLVRPSTRLVIMLHSTADAHWLDKWVTRIAGYVADEWWGDSIATLNERITRPRNKTKRVISFVTRRPSAPRTGPLTPTFIFWGRISPEKGIDRAIRLFAKILQVHRDARFIVVGPDGGALQTVLALVEELGIGQSVVFKGQMPMEQICIEAASASFYLQTSHFEGMAMAVVEAMQMGLVPVVTPVGEIRNYCRHFENGILIESTEIVPETLLQVLKEPETYAALSRRATTTWANQPLYAESMLSACRALLDQPGRRNP